MKNSFIILVKKNNNFFMEIRVAKGILSKILNFQSSIINKKTTVPVLSHGVIEVKDGRCNITGTDLDNTLFQSIDCKVIEPGLYTFPAHTLNEIVKRLDDKEDIQITADKNEMKIVSGKSVFNLSILNVDDFPVNHESMYNAISDSATAIKFAITKNDFLSLIDRTYFAMSVEEARYALNGLYVHSVDNYIRCVATDGHRLSVAQVHSDYVKNGLHLSGVIISRKTISELKKILVDYDHESVFITIANNQIMFLYGSTTLISKLVDGHFPDYARAIPYKNEQSVELYTKDLHTAILRLSSISDERVKVIRMHFDLNNNVLLSSNEENSYGKEEIAAISSNLTRDFSIAFNGRYVLDITSNTHDDKIKIILDESSPIGAVIVASKPLDEALNVLMPMRV